MAVYFLFYSWGGQRVKYVTCLEWGWWVICKISKEDSHHQKRCDTCKAALSSFEVPVCIVEANKGIFLPLSSQKNISQTGKIRRGVLMYYAAYWCVFAHSCMCIWKLDLLLQGSTLWLFSGAPCAKVCCCCKMWSGGGVPGLEVDKRSTRSMWAGVVEGRRRQTWSLISHLFTSP